MEEPPAGGGQALLHDVAAALLHGDPPAEHDTTLARISCLIHADTPMLGIGDILSDRPTKKNNQAQAVRGCRAAAEAS